MNTLELVESFIMRYLFFIIIIIMNHFVASGQESKDIRYAKKCYVKGAYSEAETILVNSILSKENRIDLGRTYFLLGKIASAKQEDSRAITFYTLALKEKFEEELYLLYRLRAISYNFTGQKEEACKDLEQAKKLGDEQAKDFIGRICW
jgi:tetratricopeptide (TPR) repeat protein